MVFEWLNDALLFLVLILPYFSIFLLGLFVGSFLNVVADRTSRDESFIGGRSHCEFCNTILKVVDLIPVLSFLSTFGKCRYCKRKLSVAYPLSEVFTGFSFVLALSLSNYVPVFSVRTFANLAYLLIVFSFYIAIFLADFKYQIIPNKVVIPAILFVFIGSLVFRFWEVTTFHPLFSLDFLSSWGINVLVALLLAGFFWFLYAITKGKGMGFGDVRLAFLIGLFHPFPQNVVAIFGSFVIGAVFSVFLMIFGKAGMKTKIAFGPFMIISSMATLVFGKAIVGWYVSRWFGL
jgi:leader peptidase (prepilin peptidase)/N-methyltransferase